MSRRLALEYGGKRRLYPRFETPDRARRVFHVCQWKTASQWVQAVLSDPRLYRRHRLLPYAFGELFAREIDGVPPLQAEQRGLFLSFFSTREEVEAVAGDDYEAFVVVRHPVDVLISWYVSTRYTHPPTPEVEQRRTDMARFDDLDGLRYMVERYHEQSDIPRSWLAGEPRPRFLRYEDLVLAKDAATWERLAGLLSRAEDGAAYRAAAGLYDRIVKLRGNRLLFAGSKYAPSTRIDRDDRRFAEICAGLVADYPDLFEAFGYDRPEPLAA
jgi:hypothetical protein